MANQTQERNLFLETDLALHEHCQTCVILCIPNLCQRYGCTVIPCPQDCGSRFHSCKTEEHLLLCPLVKTPCINAVYGCPQYMPRRDLGRHLSSCPASVVYCNMERNRKPLRDFGKKLKKKEGRIEDQKFLRDPTLSDGDLSDGPSTENASDSIAVDLALAYSDQRQINNLYRMPKSQRKAATNFFNKRHPATPLLSKHGLVETELDHADSYPEDDADSSDDENAAKRRTSIVSPVAMECILCKIDPSSQHLHQLRNMGPTDQPPTASDVETMELDENANAKLGRTKSWTVAASNAFYADRNLLIDLSSDFLPTHYPKCGSYYTIVCDQSLRRDEYARHFANVHNDIVDGLDGWALVRCPLWRYGCGCYATRLEPAGEGRKIVYNRWRDSFAVKFENASDDEIGTENRGLGSHFLALPYDVIRMICTVLDANSLFCLASACKELNEFVRFSLLSTRGLVERPWIKTDSRTAGGRARWIQGVKRWRLSKSFEHVHKWKVNSTGRFVDHIQKCHYYEPVTHKEDRVAVLTFAKPFMVRPSRNDVYRAVPMVLDDRSDEEEEENEIYGF